MRKLVALIILCRPKQWIKNSFVFAGVIFSRNVFNPTALFNSVIAFSFFCIASSLIYILNDIVDCEQDKLHPKKKHRPLPSGRISRSAAIQLLVGLILIFLSGFLWWQTVPLLIMLIYIGVNFLYTFFLKHLMFIDIFTIAIGFVLRVLVGTVAIDVEPSPWLLLCTLLLALFLGLGKRKNELLVLGEDDAANHRKNLKDYSQTLIDQWLSITTASTIMAYSLYTFSAFEGLSMMLTIPFVIYGLFRYQYLIFTKNAGGNPEAIVVSDPPFLVNTLLWISSIFVVFYFS